MAIVMIGAMTYALILLANIAALLPVWFGHWSVFALLGLYWFENVVTGVIQFLKMRAVERLRPRADPFGMANFFALHYGMFTAVHGIFVLAFFGLISTTAREGGAALWWLSALIVAASLALAYHRDFVRSGEAARANLDRLMFEPYGRVVVLHLVVLIGGALALDNKHPRLVLMVLVLFKLGAELITAYLTQQRRARAGA